MSKEMQKAFEQAVFESFSRRSSELALEPPQFEESGFLTSAKLKGKEGFVEILFGPPEYHAELFIEDANSGKRFGFADLLRRKPIAEWVALNKPDSSEELLVKREVDWFFSLIQVPLKSEVQFRWVFNSDA